MPLFVREQRTCTFPRPLPGLKVQFSITHLHPNPRDDAAEGPSAAKNDAGPDGRINNTAAKTSETKKKTKAGVVPVQTLWLAKSSS